MSDTWSNIQAHKKQLDSLRERLQRRRKDPAQLSAGTSSTYSSYYYERCGIKQICISFSWFFIDQNHVPQSIVLNVWLWVFLLFFFSDVFSNLMEKITQSSRS